MKEKLLKLMAEADRLHAITFDDSVDEATQDEACDEYYKITHEIADWLTKFSLGQIKGMPAIRMAVHKRKEILALAMRWDERR